MNEEPFLLAALAVASVGLWTLRVAITARGKKLAGSLVAAVEAVVFALTFSHLVTDLGSPDRLIGYALGVAAGTALGLFATDQIAPGHTELHIVVSEVDPDVADSKRARGWPATSSVAQGPRGPATQIWVTVDDVRVPALLTDVEELAAEAFWTLRRLRAAHGSPLPSEYNQIRNRSSGVNQIDYRRDDHAAGDLRAASADR